MFEISFKIIYFPKHPCYELEQYFFKFLLNLNPLSHSFYIYPYTDVYLLHVNKKNKNNISLQNRCLLLSLYGMFNKYSCVCMCIVYFNMLNAVVKLLLFVSSMMTMLDDCLHTLQCLAWPGLPSGVIVC